MKIDGVNNSQGMQIFHAKKSELTEPAADQVPQELPNSSEIDEPSPVEPEQVNQEDDDSGDSKGVLRLLQEGHFKGVADVRLRINFFDKLAALEATQKQAVTEEKMGGVLESLNGVVDSFLADNELTEEQSAGISEAQESFIQAVNEADDPAGAAEDAFAAFIEALQGLFAIPLEAVEQELPAAEQGAEETEPADGTEEQEVPAVDEGTEETETVGGTEEPSGQIELIPPAESGPDWQGFIENLQAAFTTAMEQLNSSINAVSVLPPLSEPSGNGVAYEKFLAIYNQMLGVGEPGNNLDESEPAEPVE